MKLCKDSLVALDSLTAIEATDASFQCLPTQASMDELNLEVCRMFKDLHKKKYGELAMSTMLQQMAYFATVSWQGSQYADKRRWTKLEKHFNRAKRTAIARFSLIDCVSFRISLVNGQADGMYVDKNVGTSVFNLYKVVLNEKNEEEEEAIPIPIAEKTLDELKSEVISQMKKRNVYQNFKKGIYSCLGVSIILDERTLNKKNTLPSARVVLFFGAKRLQRVKLKKV